MRNTADRERAGNQEVRTKFPEPLSSGVRGPHSCLSLIGEEA